MSNRLGRSIVKNQFPRRIYHSPKELFADLRVILAQRSQIRRAFRELLTPAFRERLMLAVTQVNACRYCSYFHARQALSAGVTPDELNALLAGQAGLECPPEERLALLYAQHWAESDARPDPEAVDKFVAAYGQETAGAIHLVLRMIRMGNLAGNTGDYLLYRLSFGKLGLTETN